MCPLPSFVLAHPPPLHPFLLTLTLLPGVTSVPSPPAFPDPLQSRLAVRPPAPTASNAALLPDTDHTWAIISDDCPLSEGNSYLQIYQFMYSATGGTQIQLSFDY